MASRPEVSRRVTVRIPAVIHSKMKEEIEERKNISVSWIIIRALADRYGLDFHSENENGRVKYDVDI